MGGLKIPLNQGRINLLGKDKDLVLKDPDLKEMMRFIEYKET